MNNDPTDLSKLKINRSEPIGRKPRRFPIFWVILIILMILSLYGAYGYLSKLTAVPVEVSQVELRVPTRSLTTGISANGYVIARIKASVSSKISGRLAYIGVSEGDFVKKGSIIARIENDDFKAAVERAEANIEVIDSSLEEARVNLEQAIRDKNRIVPLFEEGYATEQEKDNAEFLVESMRARIKSLNAQLGAARAALKLARVNLENTYIRAPFDGEILSKDAEIGEIVTPAVTGGGFTRGAVVTMADLSTLEVEADVNESYISRITTDQPVEIMLDAFPGTTFRGKVRQVIPTADRQKATVIVKVSILDTDPRILPEMGAKVTFLESDPGTSVSSGDETPLLFVHDSAIRVNKQKRYVWLITGSRVHRRYVKIGAKHGNMRLVKSGLSEGDTVVVSGFKELKENTRVKIITR